LKFVTGQLLEHKAQGKVMKEPCLKNKMW